MNIYKIYSALAATLILLIVVILSYLSPVSAQAETNIFTDLNSFQTATDPLTEINFENLPRAGFSNPNGLINGEYIPNPLTLHGVTITDPIHLRTGFCASPICQPDPDNRSGENTVTFLNQDATIAMPVGTGGALLVIEGMNATTFTLRATDFVGNSIDVDSQTNLNNPTYLGFTSTNGIQQIEVVGVGVPDASLALSAIYVELNDPDVTVGVWADPEEDIEHANGDLVWGSATVQDEIVDLRVKFLDSPFLKSKSHEITWCFNTDDNATTGIACGYTGADTEFTLSGGTDALFGGAFSFNGALSTLDPCSVGSYDWDTNTLRLMVPLSLLSDNNSVAFAVEGVFKQSESNTLQTYTDLAPDVADFSVTGSFFSSLENKFAPFNGLPLCSPFQEMSVPFQATGSVQFFPELDILRYLYVDVYSSYSKTTNDNRRFTRGFLELTIPELPDGVEIAEATLILPEVGVQGSAPLPPNSHIVSYYHAADLVINTDDFDRTTTPVHQTFESDGNIPFELFSIDVTDAINSNHEGDPVGFMIKVGVDLTYSAMGSLGTGFERYADSPPRILLRLAKARADVDSELGGTLLYTNDQGLEIEVFAPAGVVSETTRLALESEETTSLNFRTARSLTDSSSTSGSLVQVNSDFTLDAYQNGRPRSGSILQEPIIVTLQYTNSDVAMINEDTLILNYWNGSDWEYAACGLYERHPDENWLSVPICHFGSKFALFGLPVESIDPIVGLNATNDGPTQLGQSTDLTASITSGTNVNYSWAFGDGETGSGANVTHTYPAVGEYTAVVTATNSINEQVTSTIVTVTDESITGLNATNDGPTEVGQNTLLTAAITSGTNVNYSWSFGDGETGSGAIVSHTYPAVGEYTAVVTATNSINQLVTTTIVTVTDGDESDEPIVGLNAINDGPTELGQSTVLTASVTSGTDVSYSWAFGDGETGSGANVTHTYPAVGEYTAVVTASNTINELVTTTTVMVTDDDVSDEPIVGLNAINDSPTELGQSTILTASITSGTNVNYSWSFGDGETGSGAIVTHTYPAVGEYTAVVTATNSINTVVITVPVSITVSTSDSTFYTYLPVVLMKRP